MPRPERDRAVIGVVLLAALVMLVHLGARIFGNNDEARFPLLAQAALERGEWFFPRINGVVYHTKPLLLAWLIAAVSLPFGRVTQLTAVVPSAVAAVATVTVVYALGRALFGRRGGWAAALAAMTTSGLFFHGRLAMPDMPLACFTTAAMACFWFLTSDPSLPPRDATAVPALWRDGAALGFYGFAVAGFWTKGVPGLLPLVLGPTCAWMAGRSAPAGRVRWHVGVPLVVLLVAPWWLAHVGRDSGEMRSLVLYDQLFWYLPRTARRAMLVNPLQNALSILFPWTVIVPSVVAAIVRARRPARDAPAPRAPAAVPSEAAPAPVAPGALAFVVTWAVLTAALAAVSQEQRLRYWVPLVPPVALLVGWWCVVPPPLRRARPRPWPVYAAFPVVAVAAATVVARVGPRGPSAELAALGPVEALVLAAALGTMLGALARGAASGSRLGALTVAAGAAGVLLVAGYHGQLVRHNRSHDYPRLQAAVAERAPDTRIVAAWGVHEMPLTFYARHPVPALENGPALRRALDAPARAAVVSDRSLPAVPDVRVLFRDRIALRPVAVVVAPREAR
jgi:4-amino-4-deoxy-L-arabinose transferase-like glycosyltransferase